MLKAIALAGIFVFTSAVSTVAYTSAQRKHVISIQPAPTAPQPQGFCLPPGTHC